MSRHVVVCGLPRSGNRLVRSIIQHAGPAASIIHGYPKDMHKWSEVRATHAVVPVRCSWARRQSIVQGDGNREALEKMWGGPVEELASRRKTFAAIIEREIPFLLMSYEALVSRPTKGVREIYRFLGFDEIRTRAAAESFLAETPIYDANAKYSSGPLSLEEYEEVMDD